MELHFPSPAGRMSLEEHVHTLAHQIVEFVRAHEAWAMPIVGTLAFGESLAFISLVLPAWAVLVALGTLIGESGISFLPIWVAGAAAAALSDWLSYWAGIKLGPAVARVWPLSRNPGLLSRGRTLRCQMGVAGDLHRPILRPVAGHGAPGGRHLPHAVLALSGRQFRFRLRVGRHAADPGGCCGDDFQFNMAMSPLPAVP
jgi:hypothetical protein